MRIQSAHESQTGMPASGQRRRVGAWILLAWVAFWPIVAAQPHCSSLVSTGGSGEPMSVANAADPMMQRAGSPSLPLNSYTDCPELAAVRTVPTNAATAATERPEILMAAPYAPLPLTLHDARTVLTSNVPYPPSPGAPLYLRTQRFRI
jgi:hypothetical protein